MKLFSILLLFSFGSIAVFGFLAMHTGTAHIVGCVATMTNGFQCPGTDDFSIAYFHAKAFKAFSLGTLSAFVFFLLLAVFSAAIFSFAPAPAKLALGQRVWRGTDFSNFLDKQELIKWLARRSHSPTSF